MAESAGMKRVELFIGGFTLTTFRRITRPDAPIRIYIEGDGLAWITPTQPSPDPTPRHAVALALAVADNSPNVVYLARPCQFNLGLSPRCETAYWTGKRFAAEVIRTMDLAVDDIMQEAPGQQVELVGYSGGAAVAVLVAAKRRDVANLRTVAGNLDHAAVNRYHRVGAMPESLNPADVAHLLASLPQIHFHGDRDAVIPGFVAQSFAERVGTRACLKVVAVKGATHGDGWQEAWPGLLGVAAGCDAATAMPPMKVP